MGETIPWWSFDDTAGTWTREGIATVFDNGGTLWTRADVTHFSWWNVDQPLNEHGCICVDVEDGSGDPLGGVEVIARGVSYSGTSTAVQTDSAGRACVTVPNSATQSHSVDIIARVGSVQVPHLGNPISTPSTNASCVRNENCPDGCGVASTPISAAIDGTVQGTVTNTSDVPQSGLMVLSSHGTSSTTDGSGNYTMPVVLDLSFNVFTLGYSSPQLLATAGTPVVTHDFQVQEAATTTVGQACQNTLLYCPTGYPWDAWITDQVSCEALFTCVLSYFSGACEAMVSNLANCMAGMTSSTDCGDCEAIQLDIMNSCPEPSGCLPP